MKTFYKAFPVLLVFLAFVAVPYAVQALTESDIVFPVAELGSCEDKDSCKLYCDDPNNLNSCVDFATKYNLMSEDEADHARKFSSLQEEHGPGPGSCESARECRLYCDNVANMDECIAFAEENDLMPPEELAEAKKVQQALRGGAQMPGGCTSKESCEAYCEDPVHMRQCVAFAEAAGFMDERESQEANKFLLIVENGNSPGDCTNEFECKAYCENGENTEECVDFAVKMGHMDAGRADMMRETKGRGPGGCMGDECRIFCGNPENRDACHAFATEHGLVSKDQQPPRSMARQEMHEGFVGPGGCTDKDECDDYCSNEENEEECSQLMSGPPRQSDNNQRPGLIDERRKHEFIDENGDEERPSDMERGMPDMPPEIKECVKDRLGNDAFERADQGDLSQEKIRDAADKCFGEHRSDENGEESDQHEEQEDGFKPSDRQGNWRYFSPDDFPEGEGPPFDQYDGPSRGDHEDSDDKRFDSGDRYQQFDQDGRRPDNRDERGYDDSSYGDREDSDDKRIDSDDRYQQFDQDGRRPDNRDEKSHERPSSEDGPDRKSDHEPSSQENFTSFLWNIKGGTALLINALMPW